jgi:tyrosyl-tRNA synthetase
VLRLSAYDYWQFWRNTEDADVGRFLRMFTDLPLEEIRRLEALQGADLNEAKIRLATEATRLCHGEAAAQESMRTAAAAFTGGAADGLPTVMLAPGAALPVIEAVIALGMATSRSEARRLVEQGGVKLNDQPVTSATASVSEADLDAHGTARLAVGKKRHGLVKRPPT